MKLEIEGTRFYQDDDPTYTRRVGFASADEGIRGLMLGVCDELELAPATSVEQVAAILSHWRECGVIAYTLDIGLSADVRLDEEGLAKLRAILDAGSGLDMVTCLRFSDDLAEAEPLGTAWELLVVRLLRWGLDRVVLIAPRMPASEQIAAIDRARDAEALHNTAWGHEKKLLLCAALSGIEPAGDDVPTLLRRADLACLDLRDGGREMLETWAEKTRDARSPLVVQGPGDGQAVRDVVAQGVSWLAPLGGSHTWLDETSRIAGEPAAPRSVTRFQHRIKSGHETVVRRQRKTWRWSEKKY